MRKLIVCNIGERPNNRLQRTALRAAASTQALGCIFENDAFTILQCCNSRHL